MKRLILIATLASTNCLADGVYIFTGISHNPSESASKPEVNLQTPLAYFGIKYVHGITEKLTIETGYRHESSISQKEMGIGLNTIYLGLTLKLGE